MRRENHYMVCTLSELAQYLWDSLDDTWGNPDFISEVDFSLFPEGMGEDQSVEDIEKKCEGWYGIKSIDTGMDSSWLNVVADIYGGGTAEMITIFEKDEGALQDIEGLISRVLQANQGVNCDKELLFVEIRI